MVETRTVNDIFLFIGVLSVRDGSLVTHDSRHKVTVSLLWKADANMYRK